MVAAEGTEKNGGILPPKGLQLQEVLLFVQEKPSRHVLHKVADRL
jgi:hypothetical protein